MVNAKVAEVTARIIERSRQSRAKYVARMEAARNTRVQRSILSCDNLAPGFVVCGAEEKNALKLTDSANVAIITAYNDMLSAHQPFEHFPQLIKEAVHNMGSVAQVAVAVPAMCDGVTLG